MTLGMIGLGRMGGNMARRLRRADVPVIAWNREQDVSDALAEETGLTSFDVFSVGARSLCVPTCVLSGSTCAGNRRCRRSRDRVAR